MMFFTRLTVLFISLLCWSKFVASVKDTVRTYADPPVRAVRDDVVPGAILRAGPQFLIPPRNIQNGIGARLHPVIILGEITGDEVPVAMLSHSWTLGHRHKAKPTTKYGISGEGFVSMSQTSALVSNLFQLRTDQPERAVKVSKENLAKLNKDIEHAKFVISSSDSIFHGSEPGGSYHNPAPQPPGGSPSLLSRIDMGTSSEGGGSHEHGPASGGSQPGKDLLSRLSDPDGQHSLDDYQHHGPASGGSQPGKDLLSRLSASGGSQPQSGPSRHLAANKRYSPYTRNPRFDGGTN